ncbi:DUF7005 family protein [Polaribacter cellanae]|uniref:Uncharacterized protein n=1 Tax=Polaribacter cellanae TaxID=2818493 RepID=A0A975CPD4_9FLAO|nr:hypothetical protein [Polaribacter cellanae]QTE23303.1 hypothetical protein J3359_03225 [Polaribacter cellanae]
MTEDEKYTFLKELVKEEQVIDELLIYSKNKFISNEQKTNTLLEDSYVDTWERYSEESKEIGVFETLKKYIVQLQFPVQKGISKTGAYINTTLRGKSNLNKSALKLNQPKGLKLEIYKSALVGSVPVLIIPDDEDFNTLVCALSNKNEPKELTKSMGASFINGINNWDRIHQLKADWLQGNSTGNWSLYFKENILPKPHLFKDKLIILSTKEYSGIKSQSIGVSKSTWKLSSLIIRREHECAHLFTLKHYGVMANNMHDEIIADYAGITKVLGHFNKDWCLHFIGLENYPKYRNGARLENYQGKNKLSEQAFEGLKRIIKNVTESIFQFDNSLGKIQSATDQLHRIKSICEVDLITMASSKGKQKLMEKYNSKQVTILV